MSFSQKQTEFFQTANHRWNFKTGATRSGKTYMDYFLIPKRIRARTGKDGLCVIMGVSKATIERNILEPMRGIWSESMVGRIGSNNTCKMFGETVHCLGAEKISQVSKLRGASIKYCYGDEVADWSPQVFELLKSRLDKPYSCFDGALNPQGANHWLKAFLDSDADIYNQKYTLFDNPFLPQEFVENLCKEYKGTVFYDRYVLGEWALAEGLIYPMYQDALESESPGEYSEYVLSIDYGTQNAFAAILCGRSGDTWHVFKGYYYSGRTEGKTKTDEDYKIDMVDFVSCLPPQVQAQGIETIIDPSAASFKAALREVYIPAGTGGNRYESRLFRIRDADNAVVDGIRDTARCLQRGNLKINENGCPDMVKEFATYAWDADEEDRPIKVDDHAMDALRYFVKTKRLVRPVASAYRSPFRR